jgi:hypothetical protein
MEVAFLFIFNKNGTAFFCGSLNQEFLFEKWESKLSAEVQSGFPPRESQDELNSVSII